MPVDPHHPCKALQSDRHVLERNSPPPLEKHLHCLEDHQVILARVWEMLPGSLFPFPTFSRTLVIWMVLMDSLSNMVTWPKHAQQKQGFSLPRPTLVRQKNWAGRSRLSFWIRNGKKQTQKKKTHPPEPSWNPHRRPYVHSSNRKVFICWQILKCHAGSMLSKGKKYPRSFCGPNYRYKWMLSNFWLLRADL